MTEQTTSVAVKRDIIETVAGKIRQFLGNGEIAFPATYNVENALKSAWLILQQTVDRDKRPALEVCTRESIANSLLDMAVQGLSPARKQCYFIVYGKTLTCQRSYFGDEYLVRTLTGAIDLDAHCVYEGDVFEYDLAGGRCCVTKHLQKLENINSEKIVAAYCVIVFSDCRKHTEIMTIDQIHKSWAKSRANNPVHKEFPDQMAIRTVLRRAAKRYINSSSDNALVVDAMRRQDDVAIEAEIAEQIETEANQGTTVAFPESTNEQTESDPFREEK